MERSWSKKDKLVVHKKEYIAEIAKKIDLLKPQNSITNKDIGKFIDSVVKVIKL